MASRTVGFAVASEDQARLERLVEKYGSGNRSAFLRAAMDQMEALDRAERLRGLQAYGAAHSAAKGLGPADVESVVDRVLSRRPKKG